MASILGLPQHGSPHNAVVLTEAPGGPQDVESGQTGQTIPDHKHIGRKRAKPRAKPV